MGWNSAALPVATGCRSRPSPRSSERMPVTQPRHESCAMMTVISEITTARPMKK